MIFKLIVLMSLMAGDEGKTDFNYPHPDNKAKESYVLNLLNEGMIKDENHVFNADELSIRNIKHIIYLQPEHEELSVVLYANCGVTADSSEFQLDDSEKSIHYNSLEIILDSKGQITSILPSFNENPCKPDSRVFNNKHIDVNLNTDFQVNYSFQENITPKVVKHVKRLADKGKLVFNGYTLKPENFNIESIEYNELVLQNYHGIGVNLIMKCDLDPLNPEFDSSPFLLQFFIYPNGDFSEIYGSYGIKIDKPCDANYKHTPQ